MKKIISILLILATMFNIISYIYMPQSQAALSSSYTQSVKVGIDAFPESYKESLRKLQEIHPNWTFKAYYTGIDWNELTSSSAENKCMKNTIKKIELTDPSMLCICGRTGDPGYYCCSAKTVNYYLDPRNFLIESSIFQFLDLRNKVPLDEGIIRNIVADTYLSNYISAIIEASNQADVNPLHIISTIYQEIGTGKNGIPKAISGTVPGYEGLYNFYNYAATDGVGAVERGMIKARELGWTTPEFALIDGAVRVLKGEYLAKGQLTKYFYKFDVVGNEIINDNETKNYPINQFYGHQYMTNIQDPSSQSGNLMEYYTNNGKLNSDFTFVIPVYENMPEKAVSFPTTLTEADGELYYINTTHVTSLNAKDAAGNSVGKFTKGQTVAVQSIENNKAYIKMKVATSIGPDENGKNKWNYEDRFVYLNDASYLKKYETASTNTPIVNTPEFKVEEINFKMTPTVSVKDIKKTYPNAIIKNDKGTDISATEEQIGTGYKIIIDNIEYTAIKYGDCSGDGIVDARDSLRILKYTVNTYKLENEYLSSVDLNKDGIVDARDSLRILKYNVGTYNIGL